MSKKLAKAMATETNKTELTKKMCCLVYANKSSSLYDFNMFESVEDLVEAIVDDRLNKPSHEIISSLLQGEIKLGQIKNIIVE